MVGFAHHKFLLCVILCPLCLDGKIFNQEICH
jgi:hypothetical protein